jgi:hypothetical protein
MSVAELLSRNLNDRLPTGLRPFLEPDERALIIIRGIPGAIVATDRRVLVERSPTPMWPEVYPYRCLSGANAHLGLFSRRFVALEGPGLKADPGAFEIGLSRNATVVQIWRLSAAQQAADELNELIPAMAAAEADQPPTTDPAEPGSYAWARGGRAVFVTADRPARRNSRESRDSP